MNPSEAGTTNRLSNEECETARRTLEDKWSLALRAGKAP